MPSALPTISRRRLLVTALPAGVVLTALGTAAACAPAPPPPELADLVAQFERAHADSRLAGLAATTARPRVVPALTAVASVRAAHARALSDEITRITGGQTPTTSSTATSEPTSAAPAPAPTVADVTAALHTSADSAARLAATLSGYRAGLLGSIAAACTASYQVALADPGQAR
ncbi:hypothetical protein [Mycolicibacterium cosmeticum]|uniref:Tat pathway signal sequence domain-containing protein n=1 Tax=Mycolicibacterium cosmeticum TaxID=258533 RepID=W9BM46_MYCCO|nr:hypothetical protein [Mycolicibacterium cosmeticum]CDO10765.1 Tat pathway signal sequence domain-containing protein [Mycolicibacterium cosmeticum]